MLFSEHHIWVQKMEDETVKIGLSDYAQEQLGGIMFLNLPDEGEIVEAGKAFGDIESIKTVSDLIAPCMGKVKRVNESLMDQPDAVNIEPYNSWMLELTDISFTDHLMTKQEYEEFIIKL